DRVEGRRVREDKSVCSGTAGELIRTALADDRVVVAAAVDGVVPVATHDEVVAGLTIQGVAAAISEDQVIAASSGHCLRCRRRSDYVLCSPFIQERCRVGGSLITCGVQLVAKDRSPV